MKITAVIPIPRVNPPGIDVAIVAKFHALAGARVVEVLKTLLGSEEVYTLSPEYAADKHKRPEFKSFPGKASDQPLILSGGMYEGISWWAEGTTLVAGVEVGAGIGQKGFDYAQRMEALSSFLEQAFAIIEPELGEMMMIVVDEVLDALLVGV